LGVGSCEPPSQSLASRQATIAQLVCPSLKKIPQNSREGQAESRGAFWEKAWTGPEASQTLHPAGLIPAPQAPTSQNAPAGCPGVSTGPQFPRGGRPVISSTHPPVHIRPRVPTRHCMAVSWGGVGLRRLPPQPSPLHTQPSRLACLIVAQDSVGMLIRAGGGAQWGCFANTATRAGQSRAQKGPTKPAFLQRATTPHTGSHRPAGRMSHCAGKL